MEDLKEVYFDTDRLASIALVEAVIRAVKRVPTEKSYKEIMKEIEPFLPKKSRICKKPQGEWKAGGYDRHYGMRKNA